MSKKKIWLRADELVKLIKKYLWHKTRMVSYNGRLVPVYALNVKVKDSQVKLKAFCIMDKWSEEDDKSCHILITNDLSLDHKKASALYRMRWGIEHAYPSIIAIASKICFRYIVSSRSFINYLHLIFNPVS
ncbi:MAG: hypothetical protein Q8R31_06240 [Candidatus Omnitrophota bacterium]|nr:hypothetical protein [Candidatus Omnitrophota bacterium]